MAAHRINIAIVEPSAIIRCGIITLLQRASISNINITELAEASGFLEHPYKYELDILIINPSYLGVFALSQLRQDMGNPKLRIIALQGCFTEQSLLNNYDDVISIYDNIETIETKITDVIKINEEQEIPKKLSAREKEIIVCVVKGMTNKQTADLLCLSAHTVIAHRRNIANKLQIHSSSGLTIYAIVNKLVNLEDIKDSISKKKEDEE